MKLSFLRIAKRLAVIAAALLVCQNSPAAGFTITPNSVSNTYNGSITLQVTGTTNGETVLVQKYLDANGNGVVDPGEFLVQQFSLTGGQASVFTNGATTVTNFNVPGDTGYLTNQITAQLSFLNGDTSQNIVGKYLYVVSSPTAQFTAITNSFAVTNYPFTQSISGLVTNLSGAGVTNAVVILFPAPRGGNHGPGQPQAAVVADNSGNYSIKVPAGTYVPLAFRSGYVADYSTSPVVTVASNASVVTNVSLTPANQTITGRYVDAATNSLGLPGVFVPGSTDTGLIAIGFTDANGNFTLPVVANVWGLGSDGSGLVVHGYQAYQNDPTNVDTSAGSVAGVTIPFPAGTALFYGQVKDNLGNPMIGIDVYSEDNNSVYEQDAYTDTNGNYAVVALANTGGDLWQVQVSSGHDGAVSSYIFSEGAYSQGTNLSVGQAVHQNFTGVTATNLITGYVKDSGNNPVSGVGLFATATISGKTFGVGNANTDSNGNYSMTVASASWDVSVNCSGGNNSLSSLGYSQCPADQTVNTTTSNGVANFTVPLTTTTLSGKVVQANGQPVTFMNVFATPTNGGPFFQATTDSSGNFTMGISGGSYTVQLNTDPVTGAPALGLVSPVLPVTVTDGVNISNFVLVAEPGTGAIVVTVKNNSNNAPIEGIFAGANITFNGTNYTTGGIATGISGQATLVVFNGNWSVGLGNVTTPGQNVFISNNTNGATFLITFAGASPPTIGSPVRLSPTQVQFTVNGVTNKTYTIQACTLLPNWTNLFSTNASSSSFPVTDTTATNATRFYRVLTAP